MKLNTPYNHTLDVRLKSLEEKLDKVDSILRIVLAAVASVSSREPTTANFQQMDTDDNISSIDPVILKKSQPTLSCGIRPSAIHQYQLHTTDPSPRAPHPSNNLNELPDPRLRAPKNNTEIKSQRLPNSEDNIRSIEEPAHFDYLEREFRRTFGLPTDSGKKCTISSYDGVVLAVGYSKVVITWQGMYFRLKAEDIKFGNLRREDNPNSNVVTWSTRGVKIFQLKQPNSSNTPFPHRFAVTPPSGFTRPCNPLSTDGFYVHVYQTMVEVRSNVWITLNSKLIAKELGQMCGTSYLPRGPSHRHYAEDNQNPRMSSQRQQPYQTSHEAHQQNFLNRPFNRDQAHPHNSIYNEHNL